MSQTASEIDQFLTQWNAHFASLTVPQTCNVLSVLAIQMEWDQEHPTDDYTLSDASDEHPFVIDSTSQNVIALLEGLPPHELADWMVELSNAIQEGVSENQLFNVDRFSRQYNTYALDLDIPEKCHLLAVLAIQMGWCSANPESDYTLAEADRDHPHPFTDTDPDRLIVRLEGKSDYELATWMVELAAAVEDELSQ